MRGDGRFGYGGRRGWTVLFVLFVILFLMILGFSLISWWRTEARQSHDYVDAQVAQYLCEAAVDHALYVVKNHANDVNEPPLTDLPKKFATEDEFAFNVIPHWSIPPKDAMFPGMNVSIVEEAKKLVPTGKIVSCDVEFKKTEEFEGEQKLRSGVMRVIAIAESNGVRRKVIEEHLCHVYKNIPIKWDHVLYLNNKEDEVIPGRRDKGYSGWKKFLNALALNTKFHQQELYVNGKVFARHLVVPLNGEKDQGLMGSFETDESMIQKLGKKAVDTNQAPSQLQISGFSDFLDLNLTFREVDAKGFSAWMNGGTRGNTDLTGFDPAGKLRKFFTTLGFNDKTDRKPNPLVGDIRRVYEKKSGMVAGDWSPVVEDYVTRNYAPGNDPVTTQDGTGYDTANGYYFGKDSKTFGDTNLYPEDRIDGLFPEEIYRKIATRTRKDRTKVKYKIGKETVEQEVVRYYGFGPWQAAPSSTGFFGAIKDFFRAKTGREAAIANPEKYAIKLKGFEFVDGDAHIEGVYMGVGTIVATGNIYVGNEIIRNPHDTSGQSVIPVPKPYGTGYDQSYNDGAYNCLSLVALGTKPGPGGEETGKIIFRNSERKDFIQPGFFKNLFQGKKDMRIQGFCYAKNGIKAQFEDTSWFGFGGENSVYTIFEGNYVGEKLGLGTWDGAKFQNEKGEWPDKMVIKEDPKWLYVLEKFAKDDNKRVVVFSPRVERYAAGREREVAAE